MLKPSEYRGNPLNIFSIERDISEKKRAEKELQKQKELAETIINNIPIMIAYFNKNGEFEYINNEWEKTLGWSLDDIKNNKNFLSELYPNENDYKNALGFILESEHGWKDFSTKIKNGNYIETSWTNVKLSDGRTIGIGQDITERKKYEMQLKESENKYRQLVDHSPVPVVVIDLEEGSFIYANTKAYEILGYLPEGKTPSDYFVKDFYVNPNDRDVLLSELKEKGFVSGFEVELNTLRGNAISVIVSAIVTEFEKAPAIFTSFWDISERKLMERALRASEEKFRNIIETANEGIWIYDENNIITFANKAMTQILGYSLNEILGSSVESFIAEDDVPNFMANVNNGRRHSLGVFERKLKRKDGEVINSLISNSALFNDDGIYFGSLCMITDISEMKKAQNALIESESKFNQLFSLNPVIMVLARASDRKIVEANSTALKILEYSHEELIGKTSDELPIFVDKEKELSAVEDLLTKKHLSNVELDIRTKSGTILSGLFFNEIIITEGEKYFLTIMIDISERKRLLDRVNKLSSAVEQSPVSIIITDIVGKIEYVNSTFSKTTGYDFNEAIGSDSRVLKSGKQDKEFYDSLWKTILAGKNWNGVFQNKKKNGELFWESAIISPIKDEAGNVTHFVAIKEDISEKVEKENELKKYREHLEELVKERTKELSILNSSLKEQLQKEKELEMMLRQALNKEKEVNELKTQFISTASHEFKTPLTTVFSSAELLQRYGQKWSAEKI